MARASVTRTCSVALGLMLVASLAACSSGSSSAGSPSTSAPSTTTAVQAGSGQKPVCSLISPTEVSRFLSVQVAPPTAMISGDVTTCTYKASDISKSVIIEYETGATPASFAADKGRVTAKGAPTTAVPNLGDQAYYTSVHEGGSAVTTVALLSGSLQIVVISASPSPDVVTLAAYTLNQVQTSGSSTSTSTSTSAAS